MQGFILYNVIAENIYNLETYYNTILNVQDDIYQKLLNKAKLNNENKPVGRSYNITMRLVNTNPNNKNYGSSSFFTIRAAYTMSYKDFINFLEEKIRGELIGSDGIALRDNTIDFSFFQLKTHILEGDGKNKKMKYIFCNVKDVSSENCLYYCLKTIINLPSNYLTISTLDDVVNIAKKYDKYILVVCDYPKKVIEFNRTDEYIKHEREIYKKIDYIELKELLPANFNNKKNPDITLVWRENHYTILEDIKKDELYNTPSNALYKKEIKNNKITFKSVASRIELMGGNYNVKKNCNYTIITFDLETTFDKYDFGLLKPYSISYSIYCEENGYDKMNLSGKC